MSEPLSHRKSPVTGPEKKISAKPMWISLSRDLTAKIGLAARRLSCHQRPHVGPLRESCDTTAHHFALWRLSKEVNCCFESVTQKTSC